MHTHIKKEVAFLDYSNTIFIKIDFLKKYKKLIAKSNGKKMKKVHF